MSAFYGISKPNYWVSTPVHFFPFSPKLIFISPYPSILISPYRTTVSEAVLSAFPVYRISHFSLPPPNKNWYTPIMKITARIEKLRDMQRDLESMKAFYPDEDVRDYVDEAFDAIERIIDEIQPFSI
jgi:hypothetical protein